MLPRPGPMDEKHNLTRPKGTSNRNRALDWIRENATEGVAYFADDDNTYDPSLFDQVHDIQG